jgi:hypothetical protein
MHADGDHDDADHYYWRHRDGDRDYNRNGPSYWNHRVYRGNDPRYSKLVDRINNDRAKIAEIGPTGRHRKALQWYRDDLRNAERDMHDYRDHRTSNDLDSLGPYYNFNSTYYSGGEGSLDWSSLVGTVPSSTH